MADILDNGSSVTYLQGETSYLDVMTNLVHSSVKVMLTDLV